MHNSLASANNICSSIPQLLITLSETVCCQSQNIIFILSTPLLHPGSLACIAGWLDLLVWVEIETCELQTLVLVGFGGAQGSLEGSGSEERSVGLDTSGASKLGGGWPSPLTESTQPSASTVTGTSSVRHPGQLCLGMKILVAEKPLPWAEVHKYGRWGEDPLFLEKSLCWFKGELTKRKRQQSVYLLMSLQHPPRT